MQAVGDQVTIAAAQALEQQGEGAEVEHRIGDRDAARHRPPCLAGAQPDRRDRYHGLHRGVPFATHHPPAVGGRPGRHAEPADQGGHHIVGVALNVDGEFQEFFLAQGFAHQGVGAHQPRHDGRGAAAQAPRRRHGQLHPGLQRHRLLTGFPPYPLRRAVHEVVWAAPEMAAFAPLNDQVEAFPAPLDHPQLETVVEVQGGTEAVKARADVGSCCRHIHPDALADPGTHHFINLTSTTLAAGGPPAAGSDGGCT